MGVLSVDNFVSFTSKSQSILLKKGNFWRYLFFFFKLPGCSHTVSIQRIPWKGTAINHLIQNGAATRVMCQCHGLFVWLYTTTVPAEQSQPGAFPTKHRKFYQLKSSFRDLIHSVKSIRRQPTLNGNITYLFKDFSLVPLVGKKLCKFKFIYRQKNSCLVNIYNWISGEWFLKLNT